VKFRITFICLTLLILGTCRGYGQNHFTIEFLPGGALALPSSLSISQLGEPTITLTAHYHTESFSAPIYYSYRFGYQTNTGYTFELEMNHLKVILQNSSTVVEKFNISHGYNQVWLNCSKAMNGFTLRAGIGPVVAHPENIVRGKELDPDLGIGNRGYYVNGITSQIAVQKKFFYRTHFFISIESKFNAGYAIVDVADGYAKTPIYAFHGLLGLGASF